jgi:3D (Asp-Asp-Asp) domain-containing protein
MKWGPSGNVLPIRWGKGSRNNALEPLRSWAVDTSVIPHGTVVYVEEWDGVDIPQVGELGGFTHDGCFRADDVGGGINGNHFDFFAGTPQMWQALEGIYPTRTNFTVYTDSPRCAHL